VAALRVRPLGPDERRRLLRRLLPAGGWLVHGDSGGAALAATAAETAGRQGACAAAILCALPQVLPPVPSYLARCCSTETDISVHILLLV
jgi:hypothetical protein